MNTNAKHEVRQFLSFDIAGAEYAIPVLRVREILEYDAVTPVPTVPASIRGVMNLRGQVVPIIDLAVKFGLPPTQVTKTTCNIVVDVVLGDEEAVMGIMVESVRQVVDLADDDIEPAPAFGTTVHLDYLHGMGKTGKKFVLILNLDKLLTTDELLRPDNIEPMTADGQVESLETVLPESLEAALPESSDAPLP